MTKMQPMTEAETKRVQRELAETHKVLERELSFSPHLRKQDIVKFYRAHIANLEDYLACGSRPTWTVDYTELDRLLK